MRTLFTKGGFWEYYCPNNIGKRKETGSLTIFVAKVSVPSVGCHKGSQSKIKNGSSLLVHKVFDKYPKTKKSTL